MEASEYRLQARKVIKELVKCWAGTVHLAGLEGVQAVYVENLQSASRQQHVDDLALLPGLSLQRMDRPVLLVHGRDDGIIPLESSQYLLERLPTCRCTLAGRPLDHKGARR